MSETTDSPKAAGGWLDWANRTTAILAVVAALSSGRWGASNLQAILEQGKVNDTWSYFQAKSIKQHTAEHMRDLVALLGSDKAGDRAAAFQAIEQRFDSEAKREASEKQLRQDDAKRFEQRRDKMVERGLWFEMSFTLLQLGVVLCTIATGARSKGPWLGAIFFGVIGLLVLANGFHPVFTAPKSWYKSTSEQMEYNVSAPAENSK